MRSCQILPHTESCPTPRRAAESCPTPHRAAESCPTPNPALHGTDPRHRMEPVPAFDMWRDYLGLAAVVAALPAGHEASGDGEDTGEGEITPAPPSGTSEPSGAQAGAALCAFCKHNGESRQVYAGHRLRDACGRVQCPVLRSYVCPQCGATRDRAHTKRFCPLTRRGYASVYSPAPRNAAGKRAVGGRGDTQK